MLNSIGLCSAYVKAMYGIGLALVIGGVIAFGYHCYEALSLL